MVCIFKISIPAKLLGFFSVMELRKLTDAEHNNDNMDSLPA